MVRTRSGFTLAAMAVAVLALAGCGRSGGGAAASGAALSTGGDRPSIAARGVGLVRGTPDTLQVVMGVETRSASAREALAANNEKADALIETLKGRGVEAEDIQTSQLSIHPTYDDKGQRITGYQVNNQVTATLHDIAGAGALIDAAAGAVGDAVRVQSIGFSIDDDSALKAEARTQAVHQAQLQAEQMARAAGVKLGRIRLISEVPQGGPGPVYPPYAARAEATDSVAAVPIEPGQQELRLTVDVVWDIAG